MADHRTMIEYRLLHPKPYLAMCHNCPWFVERMLLKTAQTASQKHREKAHEG